MSKEVVYRITQTLIEQACNRALKERLTRPPFGLIAINDSVAPQPEVVRDFDAQNPFADLRRCMHDTLALALEVELNQFSSHPALRNLYHLYLTSLAEYGKQFQNDPRVDPKAFIEPGIYTGCDFMSAVLEVIPRVQDADPATFTEISRNSFGPIAQFAGLHLSVFSTVNRGVRDKYSDCSPPLLDPTFFQIEGPPRLRVAFSDKLNGVIRQTQQTLEDLPLEHQFPSPKMGCPALSNGLLRRLWDWHVETGEYIYSGLF